MADEGHRHKLHKWLRLYYATHYLVPILIDIFTRFPLVGMDFYCKDKKLAEFYEELFFDQLGLPELPRRPSGASSGRSARPSRSAPSMKTSASGSARNSSTPRTSSSRTSRCWAPGS
jgi:hypothetical protein